MSMTEAAYEALREEILTGRIPGDTLWSDREIAQRMNLSRTPIREAIQRLAAEGLVEVKPRRGTRVLPLRTDDVREIHQIAKALELEAALLLSGRDDRNIRDVEQAVTDMELALEREDRDAWVQADSRFHQAIVDNCGNRRLADLYQGHRALTDRARYFSLHLRPLPVRSAEEHRAMYEAIAARDTRRLSQLYHDHWNRTTEELLELVRRHADVMPIKASPREETK
ncbi:putative GntR-family transcriptional regulator [Pseudooceanicola batsensis HTCC2597]|uniref:Putative GntR-family transcriptional regulator n=1 Tax=Pseudooceanicola batsensis (strain ATCC BAA-863 / DSM 15984 / KCTC 12145 / HTCC2597) TaxID=252305 RepID=A3TT43_PSEBH|nr:GntR family transcriptional regulator [Pseudooceanicola batsensis]EAQ04820.1 putative GntR-family transcriptional regulator [Pseudooceanicola batsensis HTCC2597]